MKNFNNDKELLSAYIDGELSQAEKKYIEDKIKSSLELQKELSDLKKLKDLTSSSMDIIPDSPFFETRVMATLNQNQSAKFKFKRWIPAVTLSFLTVGLMILLKFNPNIINNLIEEQKSNLAGFYKENLRPLLYAANLTNEDIFNFAMYQQLPLDSSDQQILKLGYDPQGKEYFEIKKIDDASKGKSEDNLQRFVTALKFDTKERGQIDSIIDSYSEKISSLVLVNEKNSVAINPTLWNTRKAILADIITFAQKHASNDLGKLVSNEVANIDVNSLKKWTNEANNVKDKQYIFCTPDSIFKIDFNFDMAEFKQNMKKMEVELKKLDKNAEKMKNFAFYADTTFNKGKKSSKQSQQFRVFVDSNFVKVTIQNFNIPDINIEDLKIPDLDNLASIIDEATRNVTVVRPNLPQIPFNNKGYFETNTGKVKINRRIEVNLDSLMNLRNTIADSIRSEQLKEFENYNDSLSRNYNYFQNDSLIKLQNDELKKEMDNLRRELKEFREQMKNYDNNGDNKNQNNFREIKNIDIQIMEI
ncbi:MAG: hypothetical protein WAV89_14835 [Ignavibacteriaceae bacterium]